MTLAHAVLIVSLVALPFFIFAGYGRYSKFELNRLRAYENWSDKFFSLTKQALRHNPPKDWLQMLEHANECISSKHAAFAVYIVYNRRLREGGQTSGISADELQFVNENAEATDLFLQACRAGFMAMTYTHPFWGVKARSAMAEYLARDDKPAVEVREMENINRAFSKTGHVSNRLVAA